MKTKLLTSMLFMVIGMSIFAQSITINPNISSAGKTFSATISGKNTSFLTGVNTIDFLHNGVITSDATFTNPTVLNDSTITGTVSISPNIPNPYGFSLRIANTVNPPINLLNGIIIPDADTILPRLRPISSSDISGNLKAGNSEYLEIRGKNTHFYNAKNNIVKFYRYGIENKSISISRISAHTTPQTYDLKVDIFLDIKTKPGFYSISIENEIDGKLFLDSAFSVINPNAVLISSMDQRYAKRNQLKDVLVSGSPNAKFKSSFPTILFTKNNVVSKEIEVMSVTAQDEMNATVKLNVKPTAELGFYGIAYFYAEDMDTMYLKDYFAVTAGTNTNQLTENSFKVFPNPAKDILFIESKNIVNKVSIFNLMGKEILTKTIEKPTENIELNFLENNIPNGIYFIKIQSSEGEFTQKIMIE